jgi:hypothetical protein
MADKSAAGADAKPKSKKLLIIILALVLVLLLGGGAAAFLLLKGGSADEELDEAPRTSQSARDTRPRTPPQYMALDPVVINLADPGAIRYAQVGITLQVDTAATADRGRYPAAPPKNCCVQRAKTNWRRTFSNSCARRRACPSSVAKVRCRPCCSPV